MAILVKAGQTYYEFPATTWVSIDTTTNTVKPLTGPIAAYANEALAAVQLFDLAGNPYSPAATNGTMPGFRALQYDSIILNGGQSTQAVVSNDLAEIIDGIGSSAAQQARDTVEPRVAAVENIVANLPGLTNLELLTQRIADLEARVTASVPVVTPRSQIAWARLTFETPAPAAPAGDYSTIPGFPGVNRLLIGANDGSPSTTGYNGEAIAEFDKKIYGALVGGVLQAPARRCKTVREYYKSLRWSAGERSKTQVYTGAGRVPMLSFKFAPWTASQVAAREPGAIADLRSAAAFVKTLTGPAGVLNAPIWLSPPHEPENEFPPSGTGATAIGTAADYRAAFRVCVDIYREEGVTNVAWVTSYVVAPQDFQAKDFKVWHPEWDAVNNRWLTNPDGTRKKYVDILAIDWYMPHVHTPDKTPPNPLDASDINKEFAVDYYNKILNTYKADGGRAMPVIVGEMGLYYSELAPNLESTGITLPKWLTDMMDRGVADPTHPLIGVCFWNANEAFFAPPKDKKLNTSDVLGRKTTALRQIAAGKVLRTTTGATVVASTPEASRVFVTDPAGVNRVLSIPA